MRAVLRAEWTKLRTVAGPAALLLAAVVLTVAVSAAAAAAAGQPVDAVRLSLLGVQIGQAVVAAAAVQVLAGEYGTGLILVTLTAVPSRGRVLTAKALLVA